MDPSELSRVSEMYSPNRPLTLEEAIANRSRTRMPPITRGLRVPGRFRPTRRDALARGGIQRPRDYYVMTSSGLSLHSLSLNPTPGAGDVVTMNPVSVPDEPRPIRRISPSSRKKELYERIPVWNRLEERLITGEEAPTRRNLRRYLNIFRFCDIYIGQDHICELPSVRSIIKDFGLDPDAKVMMWNTVTRNLISGDTAPRRSELTQFLRRNPDCEEFIPWEANLTRRIAVVRERWLKEVRGMSYLHGPVVRPIVREQDKVGLRLDCVPVYGPAYF